MQPAVLIVAGEASADTHGAAVVAALRALVPNIELFGVGGQAMRACGFEAVIPAESMAIAGLTEVLWALPRMWQHMRTLVRLAKTRRPKVALLLDLPDFNLRLAKKLKRLGIKVVYYISPQIWAWRQARVNIIREAIDEMLVILPFEQAFYQQHNIPVRFVGHPLVEQLPEHTQTSHEQARHTLNIPATATPLLALLPGSRQAEMSRHLPVMLAAAQLLHEHFPQIEAILPVASTLDIKRVQHLIQQARIPVHVIQGNASVALLAADVAVVCSGTATLQTALLLRPMVVVYRVSWLSYQILKRLIKVSHIALVNLIAKKRLVPELIQAELTPTNLSWHIKELLLDSEQQKRLKEAFLMMRRNLGEKDTAVEVAHAVLGHIEGFVHEQAV